MAPLYFQGKIEFGVVNQSSSAFNHILSDVSLVVFQVSQSFQLPNDIRGHNETDTCNDIWTLAGAACGLVPSRTLIVICSASPAPFISWRL